jgi:hypothetical protein
MSLHVQQSQRITHMVCRLSVGGPPVGFKGERECFNHLTSDFI